MSKKFLIIGLLLVIVGGMAIVYTRNNRPQLTPQPADSVLTVAATFYPLGYIAETIAGDAARVTTIVPAGTEPHDFEPTPLAMANLESADVFVMSGTEVDAWAERLVPTLRQKGVAVVNAAEVITLLPATATDEDHADAYDPHFWLDVGRVVQIGQAVTDALVARHERSASVFQQRFTAFASELQALDDLYFDGLRTCSSRDIVVSHDAFQYLAERYDLALTTIAGISPDEEPSSRQMADIVAIVREKNIKTIFGETLVNPVLAQTIARETGATTDVLNPIEGLTVEERQQGKNYQSLMRDNLSALRRALVCQ